MPSSALPLVPTIVTMALEHRPERVLDVGPGNGKYGVLLREYAPWLHRLDAVEAEARYLEAFPWLAHIYDEIIVDDVTNTVVAACETIPSRQCECARSERGRGRCRNARFITTSGHWLNDYDLVLMVDVLEHLDHDAGAELLARIPGRVIVCTPTAFFQNPEADAGYETERHRSVWTAAELAAIRPLEVDDVYAASIGGVLVRLAPLA